MSNAKGQQPGRLMPVIIIATVTVAVAALIVAAIKFDLIGGGPRAAQTQAYEVALERAVTDRRFTYLLPIRQYFPNDYERFRASLFQSAGEPLTGVDVQLQTFDWMTDFVLQQFDNVAAAPDDVLMRWADANGAFISALRRENVQACADYTLTWIDGLPPLSPEASAAGELLVERTMQAARAGRDHPVARPKEMSEEAWRPFIRLLIARGTSQKVLNAIQQQLVGVSKETECDARVAIYTAAAKLPPAQGPLAVAALIETGRPMAWKN